MRIIQNAHGIPHVVVILNNVTIKKYDDDRAYASEHDDAYDGDDGLVLTKDFGPHRTRLPTYAECCGTISTARSGP